MADDVPIRFVGPSYEVRRKEADVQRAVNMFPAIMEVDGGKSAVYLRQAPGLRVFSSSAILTLTSNLYPIWWLESADITHTLDSGEMFVVVPENVDVSHALTAGTLSQPLLTYNNWPPESADVTHALTAGTLVTVLLDYTMDVEDVDVSHALTGGTVVTILLTYSNWPVENVDVSHAITAGTLT